VSQACAEPGVVVGQHEQRQQPGPAHLVGGGDLLAVQQRRGLGDVLRVGDTQQAGDALEGAVPGAAVGDDQWLAVGRDQP
jgi:hypothetical protein